MSQELIGIIGAATVAVALTVPAHAQVDCADWNTAAFFEAAEVSDVTRCLQMGAAPDARDKDGKSPLHFATDNGSAEAVTALLDAGADLDLWDRSGFTPLHRAAAQGSAEVVTALLDAGAAPNVRGETGMTPLHGAGTAGAVTALLDAGADLDARAVNGMTPLHFAAENGHAEAVTTLLEEGADSNVRDNDGKLPLDYAADNGQLKDTAVYWKLNDARFQSREIGEGVFRIGELTSPPTILFKVDPQYSEEARKAQYQGTAVLEVIVRSDGTVKILRVVRSLDFGLDENAIQALKQWKFRPGMRNGQPVDVVLNIEVHFNLR